MERVNVLASHVLTCGEPSPRSAIASVATAAPSHGVRVYPPGKKHFTTDPRERLGRYEGDGGEYKATTLMAKFAQRVKDVPDLNILAQKRGARDGPWTKWTWSEYYQESRRVAKALLSMGCAQHEAINVLAFNSPEWFFVAMGGILAGLTPAGIYISNGPDAVHYILEHSKCRVIFVDSDPQLQKVLAVKERCPNLKAVVHWGADCPADGSVAGVLSWQAFLNLAERSSDAALDEVATRTYPDNACYLSYTSGTTGNPKAVMYSHDNIIWSMDHLLQIMRQTSGRFGLEDREVSYMPLSHIAGNIQLLGGLLLPSNVNSEVFFAFPDAMQGSLPDTLKMVRPTHLLGVPRVWEKLGGGLQQVAKMKPELAKDPAVLKSVLGLEHLHYACTGAAPIDSALMEYFDSIEIILHEVYGMTENTAYSHLNQKGMRRIGSVGPALVDQGAGVKIVEGTGEICTWSRGVMMGYMDMPEKTVGAFDDEGFLRTGDVGEVRDGLCFITGRIKEMIITAGGENMAPVLLEQTIKEKLPALSNAVMIGDRQKYLIALLTLKCEPDGKGGFLENLAAEALAVDPACKTYSEAMQSAVWKQYLEKGIEDANSNCISRAQLTRKFHVLAGDFSPVGEIPELTATMKLRREVFHKKYLATIKQVYGADFVNF